MNLFEQRPLLVLVDAESNAILGTVPSVACGQMLMLGLMNTQINYFPIQAANRKNEWDDYDFNGDTLYVMEKSWKISVLSAHLAVPELYARRRLMRLRISYLHPWEIYCKGAMARFKGYMSDGVQAFVRSELTAGTTGVFVREYANINEISEQNALEELASKVRSLGLVEARNWAQYEKIARDMTCADSRAALEECMKRGFDALYNNAYL